MYDAIIVGARCAGVADRDAPGSGLSESWWWTRRRSRATPCRRTWSIRPACRAAALGAARRARGPGCPPLDDVLLRLRSVRARAGRRAKRRRRDCVLPAADGPGQAADRRRRRGGAEVGEGFSVDELVFDDGRVSGVRGGEPHGKGVTSRLGASSARTARAPWWPGPCSPSSTLTAADRGWVLRVLERAAGGGCEFSRPRYRGARHVPDERRPDARHRCLGLEPVSRESSRHRPQLHEDARARADAR